MFLCVKDIFFVFRICLSGRIVWLGVYLRRSHTGVFFFFVGRYFVATATGFGGIRKRVNAIHH